MEETVVERDIDINRDCLLKFDSRGRITIPANIRLLNNIDPQDDQDYYVDYYLDSIIYHDPETEDENRFRVRQHHTKKLDNRGRVTIPYDTRKQYGIDLNDPGEYLAEVTIERIETRSQAEDNGGDQ